MKRHIYVLALFTLLFSGCLIDTAETSNIDFLDEAVDNELLDRLVFPMVMAETAFLINVYEGMSAEEKLEMLAAGVGFHIDDPVIHECRSFHENIRIKQKSLKFL